nr:hypothetical protein [Tanacetum cinerariifolium]
MQKDDHEWKGKEFTIGTHAYECQDMRMRRISLRNLFMGNGYLLNLLEKMTSNETAKDLWDALERKICGSEYGEQDRKDAILYEYDTFKATEEEQFTTTAIKLLDTYLRYLQVINDLKKCGYKKTIQNQGDVNDALRYKKKVVVVTSDPLALVAEKTKKEDKKADEMKRDMSKVKCYNCKKEGHFAKDSKKAKEINANIVFMAKMEKVLSDSDKSSASIEETIVEDAIESASENFIENHIDSQKDYDKSGVDHNNSKEKDDLINQENTFEEKNNELNEQMKVLNEKNADLLAQTEVLQDQFKVKHVVIDTHTECQAQYAKHKEERYEYMIRYFALCDNDKQHRKKIEEQEILFDKMSRQLVKMNNNVLRLQEKILEKSPKFQSWKGV